MKHVWSLAPSALSLSQLSDSPHALRAAGAGGEQPLPAAVSCRCLRCHMLVLSPAPHVVSLCQPPQGTGEPHPPVGFCQSKISPVDDLDGCLRAGWYSHSKWGLGGYSLETLPAARRTALPLCSDGVDAAPRKGPLSHAVFCWKMS